MGPTLTSGKIKERWPYLSELGPTELDLESYDKMLVCIQKVTLGNCIIALKDRISTVDHYKIEFVL